MLVCVCVCARTCVCVHVEACMCVCVLVLLLLFLLFLLNLNEVCDSISVSETSITGSVIVPLFTSYLHVSLSYLSMFLL